jgi:poly(3-hydroxybutyrate) depolymerase
MSNFSPMRLTRQAHLASAVVALGCLVGVGNAFAQCPASAVSTPLPGTFRDLNIAVPGFENDPIYGSKTAFVYIPSNYQATRPTPLFILLHGSAGNPTMAIGQASQLRGLWAGAAEAGGFVIAVPAASGGQGSWIAPVNETDTPSDYDVIQALAERIARDHNIDPARRYLWGFSAGGHVTIDIALNRFHRRINGDFFAGQCRRQRRPGLRGHCVCGLQQRSVCQGQQSSPD